MVPDAEHGPQETIFAVHFFLDDKPAYLKLRCMRILLATPAAMGMLENMHVTSLLTQTFMHPDRLAEQGKYQIHHYLMYGESGLGKDRGIAASYALREGYDKIVFIDSDQMWTWEDLKKAIDSDKPILAGVIARKAFPIVLNFHPAKECKKYFEGESGSTFNGMIKMRDGVGQDEIEVSMTGTGFIAIQCKVLDAMTKVCPVFSFQNNEAPGVVPVWDFFQSGVLKETYFGEDYGFCIKAKEAGFSAFINTSVRIPHIGKFVYTVDAKDPRGG